MKLCFAVFPRGFQLCSKVGFVFYDESFYLSPCVGAVFVVYTYNAVENFVDVFFVFGGNFYACFFENLFKVSEVACHGNVPRELFAWWSCKFCVVVYCRGSLCFD